MDGVLINNIMEKEVLYNDNMHFEHDLWKSEIAYWRDELKSFNNRLSELVTRWTDKETLAKIGRYQNEFIVHGGAMEDLIETIQQHEIHIAEQSKMGTDMLDSSLAKEHLEFRNRFENQRQIYTELKKKFFRFLQKHI